MNSRIFQIRNISPSYFSLVMATGIISLSANMHGYEKISYALFYLNIVQYIALILVYAARFYFYPKRVFADFVSFSRGFGYFSVVAGTNIIAVQCLSLTKMIDVAIFLYAISVIMWLLEFYLIFTSIITKKNKPLLAYGINGSWLLSVVSTQSLAVAGAMLSVYMQQPWHLEVNFIALMAWLFGGMLYTWLIALIFYRYLFFKFEPTDLSPPYWINMGAMAISALAGSLLIINSDQAPYLQSLLPFIKGYTLLYWATGAAWIPMLVLLAVWRNVYSKVKFRYDVGYWGAIFPMGMFSAATFKMNKAMDLSFLHPLSYTFFLIALGLWSVLFWGFVAQLRVHIKVFFKR